MEVAVWMDSRGMLYTEREYKSGKYPIVASGSCKNRYQMVKYLKDWGLYEEYKSRRKK